VSNSVDHTLNVFSASSKSEDGIEVDGVRILSDFSSSGVNSVDGTPISSSIGSFEEKVRVHLVDQERDYTRLFIRHGVVQMHVVKFTPHLRTPPYDSSSALTSLQVHQGSFPGFLHSVKQNQL
jgi:hypothetical protein